MPRYIDNVGFLKDTFIYNPETGDIFWKSKNKRLKNETGRLAGTLKNDGYRRVWVLKQFIFSHRIAWAIHFGEFPLEGMHIDHINGIKNDNRIQNLRVCTPSENRRNAKLQVNSTTKFLGVYRANSRYRTVVNGKHIGMFDSAEDAYEAYKKAANEMGLSTSRALNKHAHEVILA